MALLEACYAIIEGKQVNECGKKSFSQNMSIAREAEAVASETA